MTQSLYHVPAEEPAFVAPAHLELGDAANLLLGYRPVWNVADPKGSPFFRPPSAPAHTSSVTPQDDGARWDFPTLTLHRDVESLIGRLYRYRVLSSRPATGYSVPSGPLTVGDADRSAALAALGEYLGIDLTVPRSYMLAEVRRAAHVATHESIAAFGARDRSEYLKPDAREALGKLACGSAVSPHDGTLSGAEVSAYFDAFGRFGTHFVSSITFGEAIFQVFAYESERYAHLADAFANDANPSGEVGGTDALSYDYYTTPVGKGTAGYAVQVGRLQIWSRDPVFEKSVAGGEWKDTYASPSVFAAYANGSQHKFLGRFKELVPIAFELTPLAALMPVTQESYRPQVFQRLLDGALVQKHAGAVRIPFAGDGTDVPPPSIFDADAGWLSTIVTPTVDVYQDRLDLNGIVMSNTDVVLRFASFSQLLQATGGAPVAIPGERVELISFAVDTSRSDAVPAVALSARAFDERVFACGRMTGALMFAGPGGRRETALDGFVLGFGQPDPETKRSSVRLVRDAHAVPETRLLRAAIESLQFSLVSAETQLYSRGEHAVQARAFAREFLLWLAGAIPEDGEDAQLAAVRLQALYLARTAGTLRPGGVNVPYLTYATYKDYVQSLVTAADALSEQVRTFQQRIRERKREELDAKNSAQINENIKQTGKLLTDYFAAVAKSQQDMAGYYGAIVDQKKREFDKSVIDVNRLQTLLSAQQSAVNDSVIDFKQAVTAWETEQILKFVFQVAQDVFSLGVAVAIPAGSIKSVESLGLMAQRIQKVMTVLQALSKIEEGIEKQARSLNDISRALGMLQTGVELPSALEWSEFSTNMDAALATVPTDLAGPKANLLAAFKILVLRGQALLEARSRQKLLLTEIYYNQRLQDVNADQAARMEKLTGALRLGDTAPPDVERIDLVGLTGRVQFQLKQVLAALARTLAIQDAALQYELFGQPSAIKRFDLTSLKVVMTQQQAHIIDALQLLDPAPQPLPEPIEYRIAGVPVAALAAGQPFTFTIEPSATEFFKYAMVRVRKVLARVDGIAGSDSGEYLLELSYGGNPFEDRDPNRALIAFNTAQRNFGPYDYEIATGKIKFGDGIGEIGEKVTRVTPFSNWSVSLPKTQTNKNLRFSGQTVDIVLSFHLTAMLVDVEEALRQRRVRLFAGGSTPALEAAFADTSSSTLDNLLDQMYQNQAVLKGWDVVLNMLQDNVNKILLDQYRANVGPQEEMKIDVGFCQKFGSTIAGYTRFSATLGPPLVQFQQNNSSYVKLVQPFKAGSIQTGSKAVGENWDPVKDCNLADPQVQWGKPKSIALDKKPQLVFSVPITQADGVVKNRTGSTNTRSVLLEFAKGSVVAENLSVDTDLAELNKQLSNYFQTTKLIYVINTVDFTDTTTIKALQPTSYKLNVLTTGSGKTILQIFIATSGKQENNLTIDVNEPIPDRYENSLMIGTKVMFEDIFVQSFNKGSTDFKVAAVAPTEKFKAYAAKLTSGSISGTINWGDANTSTQEFRISAAGNNLTWNMAGMKFQRTTNQGLNLSYNDKRNVSFQYRRFIQGRIVSRWGDWEDKSVDINVNLSGNYAIETGGSDLQQYIRIAKTDPQINVGNTEIKPTGTCECNDNDLKIRVVRSMAANVPAAIKSQMAGIQFSAISLFAVYNLLFPAKNIIKTDAAYVPGDLLVLGHFVKESG